MNYEDTTFNEIPELNVIETFNATIEDDFPIGSFLVLAPEVKVGNETYKITKYMEFELLLNAKDVLLVNEYNLSKIVSCNEELFEELYGDTKQG